MRAKELVFFLEEESAKIMLKILMPKLLAGHDGIQVHYSSSPGWQKLEKDVVKKIHAYNNPNAVFIVLRDQDADDCLRIKQRIEGTIPAEKRERTLIRIACRELESFFLGDLPAIDKGMCTSLSPLSEKSQYRKPDGISKPSEHLASLLRQGYSKTNGSRAIAPHLALDGSNKSRSFNVLVAGIRRQVKLLCQMAAE